MIGLPGILIETPFLLLSADWSSGVTFMEMSHPPTGEGRLSALPAAVDPAVSRALDLIHERYAEPLTVAILSREAGVSRSVLGQRFAQMLGEPPMRYCARWRLSMAAERLSKQRCKVAEVADAVGFGSEAAFNRAFRRIYGSPPSTWGKQARAGSLNLPEQQVHHCSARDGTRLAWSATGFGFPMVKAANWLNHLEFDWQSPVWRHWLRELGRDHRLIRYDERGNGLSDWDTPSLSFEAMVTDLETVVEAAGVDRFDLVALSQGAAVAIAYSLRNPGRIRRMVLLGGYARGWALRADQESLARHEAMLTLTRTGWGSANPVFRQMFTGLFIPGGTAEQLEWWNDLQRACVSPDNAARLQRVFSTIDVSNCLGQVTVPTLVAHARRDQVIPFEEGRKLAQAIPGATFLALDSENHVLLEHEPAWPLFLAAVRAFLGA